MKKILTFVLALWLMSISCIVFAETLEVPEYVSWEQIVCGGIGDYESKHGIMMCAL